MDSQPNIPVVQSYGGYFILALPVQAARNWRERQRAAWVAPCVKSCCPAKNNNDWIFNRIWYISTRDIETMPQKLSRHTFLTRKKVFAMSTVKNHTDFRHFHRLCAFHKPLQEIPMEAIQTARWRSQMLSNQSVQDNVSLYTPLNKQSSGQWN